MGGFFTIRQGNFGCSKNPCTENLPCFRPEALKRFRLPHFRKVAQVLAVTSAVSPRGFLRKNDKRLILKTKQGICKEIHMKIFDFLNTSFFSEWHIFRSNDGQMLFKCCTVYPTYHELDELASSFCRDNDLKVIS